MIWRVKLLHLRSSRFFFKAMRAKRWQELGVVKLFSVVRYQGSWDTKPASDGSPHKIAYLLLCDCGQRFSFSPLGEVIHCDDDEFALALPNGQRSPSIQTPLLESYWGNLKKKKMGAGEKLEWLFPISSTG